MVLQICSQNLNGRDPVTSISVDVFGLQSARQVLTVSTPEEKHGRQRATAEDINCYLRALLGSISSVLISEDERTRP